MTPGRRGASYGKYPSVGRSRRKRRGGRFLALLAVLAAASLLITGRIYILKEIVVTGNSQMSAAEIANLSGLQLGTNIFRVDKEYVERNLSRNRRVEVLNVSVELPNTVEISIRERVPSAAVNCAGVIMLIDENGFILERLSSLPQDERIIVVNGMDVSVNAQGSMIESGVIGQVRSMQKVLAVIRQAGAETLISELNVSNLDNLYLVSETGVQVLLGDDENLEDKLVWMQAVLEKLTQNGVMSGVLDVSSGENAVFADR